MKIQLDSHFTYQLIITSLLVYISKNKKKSC